MTKPFQVNLHYRIDKIEYSLWKERKLFYSRYALISLYKEKPITIMSLNPSDFLRKLISGHLWMVNKGQSNNLNNIASLKHVSYI